MTTGITETTELGHKEILYTHNLSTTLLIKTWYIRLAINPQLAAELLKQRIHFPIP